MARQNASIDDLRQDQISFRANKLNVAPKATEVINKIPNLNQVQFPQEAFQQPDRESMTANFISNLLPKAGEVVGDVISRGKEIAGTGLEKLTELAKDPRTYEVLSNVLAVGSAPYSPQLAQTYGNIASGIKESRIAKQEAETEKAKLDRELLKEEKKDIKNQENVLRKEFNTISKEYKTAIKQKDKLDRSLKRGTAAGDLSAIFAYMKLLDPPSVVREGEQATAYNASAVPDRVRNLYNRLLTGQRLTPAQREDFSMTSQEIIKPFIDEYKTERQRYMDIVINQNLNPKNVLGEEAKEFEKNNQAVTEKPTKSQPTNKTQQEDKKTPKIRKKWNPKTGTFDEVNL